MKENKLHQYIESEKAMENYDELHLPMISSKSGYVAFIPKDICKIIEGENHYFIELK